MITQVRIDVGLFSQTDVLDCPDPHRDHPGFLLNHADGTRGPVEQALQRMRMAAQSEGGPGYSGALETAITSAELENIKKYYGFDQPVLTRYFRWLKNLFRLDLGTSYTYEKPVLEVIASRIPVSLTFGLTGLFLTYLVCIPLGIKKPSSMERPTTTGPVS